MMTLEMLFIGLQQKGASMAMALAEAGVDAKLTGYDPNKQAAQAAETAGAVSSVVSNPYKAARSAAVIVITLPAAEADQFLRDAADHFDEGAVVLDGSPLNASSLRWAQQNLSGAHYVGMVPVVQYQELFNLDAGYQHSRADLFQDSLLGLIVPADAPERAINISVNLANAIGSRPFFIDASEMEAVTSLTDTLPAALSLALLQLAASSRGWPDIQRIAGRRFMAATHNLAEAEAESLAAKFIENRQSLSVHLEQLINQLEELRQALAESEQEALSASIDRALKEHGSWLAKRERADWGAEEVGRSQISSTGMIGNLFGFDPNRGKRGS
jgi:prephenate dehydrogenase